MSLTNVFSMVTKKSTGKVHVTVEYDTGFSTLCGLYMGVGMHSPEAFAFSDDMIGPSEALQQTTCLTCHNVLVAFLGR